MKTFHKISKHMSKIGLELRNLQNWKFSSLLRTRLIQCFACRLRWILHRDFVAETGTLASGQHAQRSMAERKLRVRKAT